MKWLLTVPQIVETADDMSREQVVQMLIQQHRLCRAADVFSLEPVDVVEMDNVACDEDKAPNGAAEENEKMGDDAPAAATEESAEK